MHRMPRHLPRPRRVGAAHRRGERLAPGGGAATSVVLGSIVPTATEAPRTEAPRAASPRAAAPAAPRAALPRAALSGPVPVRAWPRVRPSQEAEELLRRTLRLIGPAADVDRAGR